VRVVEINPLLQGRSPVDARMKKKRAARILCKARRRGVLIGHPTSTMRLVSKRAGGKGTVPVWGGGGT